MDAATRERTLDRINGYIHQLNALSVTLKSKFDSDKGTAIASPVEIKRDANIAKAKITGTQKA